PNHTHAHSNIGQLFQEKQCFDKAQQHFEKTLSLDPEHADARWNLSLLQLILGDFSQGWKNYEARYHKNKKNWRVAPLNISIPHYQGENIRGKSLLICFEQGFGDAIQCVRFLPLLKT
ncbi:tetratricopeptide repeat protein, partial [Bathymodiolus thermophilus thioautotrophic gill symbiont]